MARSRLPAVLRRLVAIGRSVSSSSSPAAGTSRVPAGLDTTWSGNHDGRPDPGEIVWTWVPYEDDPSQGKDRPVLLIGRRGDGTLVALQLTSRDHDRDAAQEARAGRFWMDIGSGPWDAQRRPSEVRLNRLIQVREQDVRREGAVLPREVYERVLGAARQYLP
ncbi:MULTISPECIES: type II toxin-antitoxin system PemK/MazF family toxin [Aeromicrobium]|uniref:type II toxin-antitoxin system PemK/MazF family toxin n=1 Tax=Aeromicrobium TaxID=2040 RepID=UPI00257B68C4|nr:MULTISPECIES: type II toxin-antitoxin system PemK/MazF family toxin [Aeromicrobium]